MTAATVQVEELHEWNSKQNAADSSDMEGDKMTDKLAIHKQILEILRPGETILKVRTVTLYVYLLVLYIPLYA